MPKRHYPMSAFTNNELRHLPGHNDYMRFKPGIAIDLALSLLIGGLAFLIATGGRIISPSNIDWLMVGDDGATHYLGWEFYRSAPLSQWPLGANPDYGAEISSSIVFSDSIPLFAMTLKPLSGLLPQPFQYLGIWIFFCFVLQVFCSERLLSNLSLTATQAWTGSIFFAVAPSFLFRMSLSHYAGSAHWIVLAALALYFDRSRHSWLWTILLCVASLINVYLALMGGVLYVADLAQRMWQKEVSLSGTVRHTIVSGICLVITMWAAGYFMAGKYTADQGYGYYRLNLLAPFLPMGGWSLWFSSPDVADGDFEGFNYFGTGVFGLLVLAVVVKPKLSFANINIATLIPITVALIACTVFAISNRIAAGSAELYAFELPRRLWPICSSFRASGRFFLPAYYLVFAFGLTGVWRFMGMKAGMLSVCTLLCVQLVDVSHGISQLRGKLSSAKPWSTTLKAEFWAKAAKQYRILLVVTPAKHYEGYLPLAYFAMSNGMSTNAVYLARIDQEKLRLSREKLEQVVASGEWAPDTLYICGDDRLWATVAKAGPGVFAAEVDGIRVVAPDWWATQ